MRHTLVALLFTLGLSACGGMEEAAETNPSSVDPSLTDDGNTHSSQSYSDPRNYCGGEMVQCKDGEVCCLAFPYLDQCVARALCPPID